MVNIEESLPFYIMHKVTRSNNYRSEDGETKSLRLSFYLQCFNIVKWRSECREYGPLNTFM